MNATDAKYFLITIDVEDWFQVENFKSLIPFSTWDQRDLRVERNIHRLLDLFDAVKLRPSEPPTCRSQLNMNRRKVESDEQDSRGKMDNKNEPAPIYNKLQTTDNQHARNVNATFFMLGWIAERLPGLLREIRGRGHEIASHGYNHLLSSQVPPKRLEGDLSDSKKLLEDIIGETVLGFRAPSFAISDEILPSIKNCGYFYDSSYNSFGVHPRYGKISLSGDKNFGIAFRLMKNFFELPISNLKIHNRIFPNGGGGYLRLIPFKVFKYGIKAILKKQNAYLCYIHPWEIDPDQPKVKAPIKFRFRHYVNLNKTYSRLKNLITSYSGSNFVTCSEYLKKMTEM